MKKILQTGCAAAAVIFLVQGASAATVSVAYNAIPPDNGGVNDCSGVFGQGFENCNVGYVDPQTNTTTLLSPIIAKYDNDVKIEDANGNVIGTQDVLTLNSSLFPSLLDAAVEFTVTETATGGTWSYSALGLDPLIKYWVKKQGPGFTLYWDVAASALATGGACSLSYYNLACMMAAQSITSGAWTGDYSHLSWYDTRPPNQNTVVPIPAALPLLLGGMGGLAWLARRQKRRSSAA